MRVACLANLNNMMFILCRYLREAGIDAHLITLSDEPAHFSPASDSYDDNYLDYYKVLPITKSTLYKASSVELLKKELADFDFFVGTDIAPTLVTLIGKSLDVFIPHGSDIYDLPFQKKRKKETNKVWWLSEKATLSKLQRLGIEHTRTILFPDEYDIHFPFKNKLKTAATYHNTSGPMVFIPQYDDLENNPQVKGLQWYPFFKKLREENDLIIFSHSRHNGFNLSPDMAIHQKGNDILIEGFAKYIKANPTVNARLVFFDYGMNVQASKDLITALEIDANIVWMPLMPRKEIMLGLNMADISCGQFDNSWLTCGVVNETLASNIPLLHYREDELYASDYETLYPLLNAKTAEDVSTKINAFMQDKVMQKELANSGSAWLKKYTVDNPLRIIEAQFKSSGERDLAPSDLKKVTMILKKHTLLDKIYRGQGKIRSKLG
ncbi:MAG: hypothetical protein GQ574_16365 [Crocinitomix sp.]|nr:hypothetical protein [Crocinitomix sp.]